MKAGRKTTRAELISMGPYNRSTVDSISVCPYCNAKTSLWVFDDINVILSQCDECLAVGSAEKAKGYEIAWEPLTI